MFDKKLLPVSRLCGLMEMAEQTWLGPLLPRDLSEKGEPARAPQDPGPLADAFCGAHWLGASLGVEPGDQGGRRKRDLLN